MKCTQIKYGDLSEDKITSKINEFVLRESLNNYEFIHDVSNTIIVKKNYYDDILLVTIEMCHS